MLLDFIKDKKDCVGCSACKSICPKECIVMLQDERGFLYPNISNDQCIKCGLCSKVCPIQKQKNITSEKEQKHTCNVGITLDCEILERSTSGGAFTEICKTISENIKNDIFIFAATINELKVYHCGANIDKISIFNKSKYIQSDIKNCFNEIKQFLDNNKYIVFCGTPCQVDGLHCFLQKQYENLFTIDFICHGVGSQLVFNRFIEETEKKYNKKIVEYVFRYTKKIRGCFPRYISFCRFSDDKATIKYIDSYNKLFLNQLCLRDSCGDLCRYRKPVRYSDITIADFNGNLNIKDPRKYSTIITNTMKGENVLQKLNNRMKLYNYDLKLIEKNNPLFFHTTCENPKRDSFFDDFIKGLTIEELVANYVPKSKFNIKIFIANILPYSVKYEIKSLIRMLGFHL